MGSAAGAGVLATSEITEGALMPEASPPERVAGSAAAAAGVVGSGVLATSDITEGVLMPRACPQLGQNQQFLSSHTTHIGSGSSSRRGRANSQ
mmetsp:Transcript_44322/g.103443  ORF Transcript_44322/g.103443 Transcript_44322/m.103443 type:complete len:93 (+) Transcript_44322:616-894(+)